MIKPEFNSTSELVDYVCKTSTVADFVPVCPFPFINEGWGSIIKFRHTDFSDAAGSGIVLQDCSITYGDSLSKWGAFEESCLYMTLNLLCALFCFQLLRFLGKERKRKAKGSRNPMLRNAAASVGSCGWMGRSTITEKVCLGNAIISLFHSAAWVDFYGYFNVLPFVVSSALKAVCASGFLLICAALITQWIWIMEIAAIVKKRKVAMMLIKWLSIIAAVSEISLSITECLVTKEVGAWDGSVNVVKSGIYLIAILNIFAQSWIYLRAINKILYVRRSSGGREGRSNDAYYAMKRYFRGMCVCVSSGILFKSYNVVMNYGVTLRMRPPCQAYYLSVVGLVFIVAQFALLWTQRSAYNNIVKKQNERKSGKGGKMVGYNKDDNNLIGKRITAEREYQGRRPST
ncbi:hypothetical protein TrRE_jg7752 [Triparma retinervis]|uniref:Transmembrane protein n=1 Tax=Triparma retinervis TaxID=2557542 RepID=A0A9W7DUM7_9STRA|nr:hypothetical protein TrRE_jg7752 [Triparma retinervis]